MPTPPDFTTGAVLTAAQMRTIGMHLIKEQTVASSAQTSVQVTNVFSANYDNYRITYTGGAGTTGHVMMLQLEVGGVVSATSYYSGFSGYTYGGAATGAGTANVGLVIYGGGGDNGWSMMDMTIYDPFKTVFTKFSNPIHYASYGGFNSAVHALATSYTGFAIYPNLGTISNGVVRVYGMRNSL
jgi:hypothetical protein